MKTTTKKAENTRVKKPVVTSRAAESIAARIKQILNRDNMILLETHFHQPIYVPKNIADIIPQLKEQAKAIKELDRFWKGLPPEDTFFLMLQLTSLLATREKQLKGNKK